MARRKTKRLKKQVEHVAPAQPTDRSIRGPWDSHDWRPTAAMVARALQARPAWARWEREAIESINELALAFRLRCASSLVGAFDFSRLAHHAAPGMSAENRAIYERLISWLDAMRRAPTLQRFIGAVQGIILCDDPAPDDRRFRDAIDLHILVCRRHRRHDD